MKNRAKVRIPAAEEEAGFGFIKLSCHGPSKLGHKYLPVDLVNGPWKMKDEYSENRDNQSTLGFAKTFE